MRIAVVGCGTAGPAAALFLSRAGHEVEVFERFPDPLPTGAGLLLQPTGMGVLDRLGLLEAVLDSGARIERLRGETAEGRTVMDLAYAGLRPALFGLGVHRGALFMLLYGALARAGIPVRTGTAAISLERRAGRTTLIDEAGARHGPYDLVVAADGARSELRALTALPARVERYPWAALWFIVEDRDAHFAGSLDQVYDGTERMVGFLPTGRSPHVSEAGVDTVSVFWSIRGDRLDAWRARGLDAWRAEVLDLAPRAEVLLDQVVAPEQVYFAAYHDVRMRRWHGDGLVVLGDAAHAMSPQLGQGANLALLDAMVLGECLASGHGLVEGLTLYQRRRRANLRFYARASRWLTPFFQSSRRPLARLRDGAMPLAARVPYVRTQMLESLCGMKAGAFRQLPPAEAALSRPPTRNAAA